MEDDIIENKFSSSEHEDVKEEIRCSNEAESINERIDEDLEKAESIYTKSKKQEATI